MMSSAITKRITNLAMWRLVVTSVFITYTLYQFQIISCDSTCDTKCTGQACRAGMFKEECLASCNSTGCHAGCIGQNCSATCLGMKCSTACNGPSCSSICTGIGCTAFCTGDKCVKEEKLWTRRSLLHRTESPVSVNDFDKAISDQLKVILAKPIFVHLVNADDKHFYNKLAPDLTQRHVIPVRRRSAFVKHSHD